MLLGTLCASLLGGLSTGKRLKVKILEKGIFRLG